MEEPFDLYPSAEMARAAIAAHVKLGHFEGDDSIQVWQLVVTLRRFCDFVGLNWREIFPDALNFRDYPDEERDWPHRKGGVASIEETED